MKVVLEDAGPCRKHVHVNAPADAVRSYYDEVVAAYAGQAKVPGFRKGKAPLAVVERQYAAGISEDTRDRAVPRVYREALDQNGISPVAVVGVSDVVFDKDEGLRFRVTVDVAPEFKLPRYTRIPLKRQSVSVTDEEVNASLERMLDSLGRFEDVSGRPVREGDMVSIDYCGECDGRPLEELAPDSPQLASAADFWIMIGEPEFLPGLPAALVGAREGEQRSVTVDFPADYRVAPVAGRQAVFSVTVKVLREKVAARIDEELLKRFEVSSEDELRARARRELSEAAEQREKARLQDEIARHLLAKTSFDVPQSVVEQETNLAVNNMVRHFVNNGATREQLAERQDEILSAASRNSGEKIKLSYILSRIADEDSITVDDTAVDERLNAMAAGYGMAPERFRAELEKRNGLARMRSDMRAEKAMDFLLDNAKIK